eukprot:TRINITY_DN6320_c0_g1_i1.p1 TRINITY_DN6320_c0_g1~~TRINITY_DN6320_c0_g1_i1.p1  ORF type:complete len:1876 (+),score=264.68 TRINITY_DN6320_c0_g1_i1:886-6513(+)
MCWASIDTDESDTAPIGLVVRGAEALAATEEGVCAVVEGAAVCWAGDPGNLNAVGKGVNLKRRRAAAAELVQMSSSRSRFCGLDGAGEVGCWVMQGAAAPVFSVADPAQVLALAVTDASVCVLTLAGTLICDTGHRDLPEPAVLVSGPCAALVSGTLACDSSLSSLSIPARGQIAALAATETRVCVMHATQGNTNTVECVGLVSVPLAMPAVDQRRAPLLSSVAPSTLVSMSILTATGSAFGTVASAAAVLIGGVVCPISSITATQITCTVPWMLPRNYSVWVTVSGAASGFKTLQVQAETGYLPVMLRSGNNHACVGIADLGMLYCWGFNGYGQLGIGNSNNIGDVPGEMPPATATNVGGPFLDLILAPFHGCVITVARTARCWGAGGSGQLGNGQTVDIGDNFGEMPPAEIAVAGPVMQLALGQWSTCSLTTLSRVQCWGGNYYGQLGQGNVVNTAIPTPVLNLGTYVISFMDAGSGHCCILTAAATVACWGRNWEGRLGIGTNIHVGDQAGQMPPATANVGGSVIQISLGRYHSCALLQTGQSVCWGHGAYGQLGVGSWTNIGDGAGEMPPVAIALPQPVYALAPGGEYDGSGDRGTTCVLFVTGDVNCWGDNNYGESGINQNTWYPAPTATNVLLSSKVHTIAPGGCMACVLFTDGEVTCWGENTHGEMGNGQGGNSLGDIAGDLPAPAVLLPVWLMAVKPNIIYVPGDRLTVVGSGFGPVQSAVSIQVGAEPCAIVQFASLHIECTVSLLSVASMVSVTRTGSGTSQTVGPVRILPSTPAVSAVVPPSGTNGTTVVVAVLGISSLLNETRVRFLPQGNHGACAPGFCYGTVLAINFTATPQTVSVRVPSLPDSTVYDIVVETTRGTSPSPAAGAEFLFCTRTCGACVAPGVEYPTSCTRCDEISGFYFNLEGTMCTTNACGAGQIFSSRTGANRCSCDQVGAGQFLDVTGLQCVSTCNPHEFLDVSGPNHQCRACDASCLACLGTTGNDCTACQPGFVFAAVSTGIISCTGSCASCQNGLVQINQTQGNTTAPVCVCPPGSYYSSIQQSCLPCVGNSYNSDYLDPHFPGSDHCTACPAFTEVAVTAAHDSLSNCQCRLSFVPDPNATDSSCTCGPGTFYFAALGICQACPLNTFKSTWSATDQCQPCSPLTGAHRGTAREGSNSTADCVCAASFSLNPDTGVCQCTAGLFLGPDGCTQCPVDTYTDAFNEAALCTPCATTNDPYRTTKGAVGRNSSMACECPASMDVDAVTGTCTCAAGSFFEASTRSCRVCPADQFTNSSNLLAQCVSCGLVGHLRTTLSQTASNNSAACVCPQTLIEHPSTGECVCEPGYQLDVDRQACRICVPETYMDDYNSAAACKPCSKVGAHRTTNGKSGSVSKFECVCDQGYFPGTPADFSGSLSNATVAQCLSCGQLGGAAECVGASTNSTVSLVEAAGVQVANGYWLTRRAEFVPQANLKADTTLQPWFKIFKCPVPAGCLGGFVEEACAEGYTGPVCGLCADGFGRLGEECAKCPSAGVSAFLVFLIVLLVIAGCAAVVYFAQATGQPGDSSAHTQRLKIAITHLQIIGFTGNFATAWPDVLIRVFAIPTSAATVSSASDNIATDCATHPSLYTRTSVILILPLILAAGVALGFAAFAAVRGSFHGLGLKVQQGTLVLLYVAHPGIVQGLLKLMVCYPVGPKRYAKSDMTVSCDDPSFVAMQAISIIYLLVYGVGGLLGLFWAMKRNPQAFVFLTEGYKPERFYWDLVVTVRKLVFVAVSLFASAPLQLFFGTWILLLSWIAHHFAHPYESHLLSKMESASLWILLITVTVGGLFFNGVLSTDKADGMAVSVLLILLNLGAVSAFLLLAMRKALKMMAGMHKQEKELGTI